MITKKQYNEMIDVWKSEYEEYKKDIDILQQEIRNCCNRYNDQINVINGLRINLRDSIKILYEFLKKLGSVDGVTHFEFVTEDTNGKLQEQYKGDTGDINYKGTNHGLIALNVAVPIAGPVIGLVSQATIKKDYLKLTEEYENAKNEWMQHKCKCVDEKKLYQTATEMAKRYRECIISVDEMIHYTILPELNSILSFLYADAIKNSIISNEDPKDFLLSSVYEYRGTAYDIHYKFVKNTFDYYKLITRIFKIPILTNILNDRVITKEERREFEKNIEEVTKKHKDIKESQHFGG